jgi:hypothetical protein
MVANFSLIFAGMMHWESKVVHVLFSSQYNLWPSTWMDANFSLIFAGMMHESKVGYVPSMSQYDPWPWPWKSFSLTSHTVPHTIHLPHQRVSPLFVQWDLRCFVLLLLLPDCYFATFQQAIPTNSKPPWRRTPLCFLGHEVISAFSVWTPCGLLSPQSLANFAEIRFRSAIVPGWVLT